MDDRGRTDAEPTREAMGSELPYAHFDSPQLRLIWGAISTLDSAELLALLEELQRRLARGGVLLRRSQWRQADAIAALQEVAGLLGRSPSVRDYETLRSERLDLELPASSSIRTRLGASWGDCLARAELEVVPDGDLPPSPRVAFQEEQLLEMLRECGRDLGGIVPTEGLYITWARRPDVVARWAETGRGRVAKSQMPYCRVFGDWPSALASAGFVGETRRQRNGTVRLAQKAWSPEELIAALRLVRERLGRAPRVADYMAERRRLRAEWEAAGEDRILPCVVPFRQEWGSWAAACKAAGVGELPARRTGKGPWRPPLYSDAEIFDTLRLAYAEVGEPFTEQAYIAWRRRYRLERRPGYRRLPGADTISCRMGGWRQALQRALDE